MTIFQYVYVRVRLLGDRNAQILQVTNPYMFSDIDNLTYDRLAPSLYTTKLVETLGSIALPNGSVCEIGVGSGVCLLSLAQRGYDHLYGTDINAQSLDAARQLLAQYAPEVQVELLQGDLWQVFDEPQNFSVVIANLPHFPGDSIDIERPKGWQGGDGRGMMDRFLRGLATHLSPDGVALITHHDLVGLGHTEGLVNELGLQIHEVRRWTVYESRARMQSVRSQSLIDSCPTLRHLGPYCFIDSRLLKISRKGNDCQ